MRPNPRHGTVRLPAAPRGAALGLSVLAGALLGLLVAACDLREAGVDARPATACKADTDCAQSDRCDLALAACVSDAPNPLAVAFQFTPPATARARVAQFTDVILPASNQFHVSLPAPVRIVGAVAVPDADGQTGDVEATIVAVAPGDIAGTQYRFQSRAGVWRLPTGEPAYELFLARDRRYTVSVMFDSGAYPTWRTRRTFSQDETWSIEVAGLGEYVEVGGRIRQSQTVDLGVAGVRVMAVSADYGFDGAGNGTQADHPLTSTEAFTDADGQFTLLVPPRPAGTYEVVVSRGQDPLSPPIPDVRFPAAFVISGVKGEEKSQALGDLFLGELPDRLADVPVIVTDADGEPVPDCEVVFVADQVGSGVYRTSTVTDASGAGTVDLFVERYDILAFPPLASPWRTFALSRDFTLADREQPFAIRLERKTFVTGHIVDFGGRHPVERASVTAVRTEPDSEVDGRSASTETDGNGDYVLPLDPGSYVFIIQPRESAGLPTHVQRDVQVPAGAIAARTDIELPRATIVEGIVSDADGQPLADVVVEVFATPAAAESAAPPRGRLAGGRQGESAAPAATDDSATAPIVGRATTDSAGTYRLLLARPEP